MIFAFLIIQAVAVVATHVEQYIGYLKEFKKPLERQYDLNRLQQFTKTLQTIADYNARTGKSYQLKMNDFADQFDNELQHIFSPHPIFESSTSRTSSPKTSVNDVPDFQPFQKYLNWATDENPFKLPLLSEVRNQGSVCRSCWAFVASSIVEAAVKYTFYNNRLTAYSNTSHEKICASELLVPLDMPPLSVQELVDCNHYIVDGCSGGNPYQSFPYLLQNGLQEASTYPYEAIVHSSCLASTNTTRYFIGEYHRVVEYNEIAIFQALQQGPVSTGICALDASFMYYSKGIYKESDCCEVQNHAVVVVGYGHDEQSQLDYWIVMNSWGIQWGENGFMRIYRSTSTSTNGMCGLALNPSQGSAGYIRNAAGEIITGQPLSAFMEFYYRLHTWWEASWREILIILTSIAMTISLLLFVYALYLDAYCAPFFPYCCNYEYRSNIMRRREGYITIEEEEAGMIAVHPTTAIPAAASIGNIPTETSTTVTITGSITRTTDLSGVASYR